MLRITIISPLPPERTGESIYTAHLIEHLLKIHKMGVTAIAGIQADPLPLPGVETKPIWRGKHLLYPFTLVRAIKRKRPHLVHVQFGPHGEVYGGMFGEIMLCLLLLLRAVGVKTTVTLHSTWMPEQVSVRVSQYGILSRLSFLAPVMFRVYMKLLDWGSTTIQLSTTKIDSILRTEFISNYGISEEKVLEIPHPCDGILTLKDKDSSQQELAISGKRIVLIFGFIRKGKGIELGIRALARLKERMEDVVLLVAGNTLSKSDCNYLQTLKKLVSELGLEGSVVFHHRFIPEGEVSTYFSATTCLLVPYSESVGASGPAHRYAGYGVPMVASDTGYHMRDALGGNLVLFKQGSDKDLARKLENLLEDPSKMKELGKELREYAQSETWDLAASRTLENYRLTLKPTAL